MRYKCRVCDAVGRRGSFCSRCGARQRPRFLRGIVSVIGTTALVAVLAAAFHSLGASVPEARPPAPSGGTWASEEDIGILDLVPGVPSLFAAPLAPASGDGEPNSKSQR
jgi:hypothetical protein